MASARAAPPSSTVPVLLSALVIVNVRPSLMRSVPALLTCDASVATPANVIDEPGPESSIVVPAAIVVNGVPSSITLAPLPPSTARYVPPVSVPAARFVKTPVASNVLSSAS